MKALALLSLLIAQPVAAEVLTVTLLGTGTPRPNIERFSQAILVETPQNKLLFDAGRGAVMRLHDSGVRADQIDQIFLTHLHFDHIVGLDDVWLSAHLWQREDDLPVAGPAGTENFVRHLTAAYGRDLHGRETQSGLPAAHGALVAQDLEPGIVFEENGLRVTAIAVSHGAMDPAFGYRIDYGARRLVISGDTTQSAAIAQAATDADVLIHEVMLASEELLEHNTRLRRVRDYHTEASALADLLTSARPRLAILVHVLHYGVTHEQVLEAVRAGYDGAVQLGEDGVTIDIGDTLYQYRRGGGAP